MLRKDKIEEEEEEEEETLNDMSLGCNNYNTCLECVIFEC